MVFESIINSKTAIYICSLLAILLICELLYFRIANLFQIGAKVTQRSSHKEYQLTGGGIIFFVSVVISYFWHHQPTDTVFIGAIILATISFIDDIKNISPFLRLLIQSIIVFCTFYYIIKWGYIDIFIVVFVCGIGFINAFNFMDGIDGITAGYSLVTLGSIFYAFSGIAYAPDSLILSLLCATIIFGFYNFRKRAVCFSGDVGSIVMGFMILYLIVELIWTRSDATYIVFLIVYGIDTVFTIIQRLFMGENIFMPHRHHLYQVFANQWGISHYKIALGYSLSQLAINIVYFTIPQDLKWTYVISVVLLLSTIYFISKRSSRSLSN